MSYTNNSWRLIEFKDELKKEINTAHMRKGHDYITSLSYVLVPIVIL